MSGGKSLNKEERKTQIVEFRVAMTCTYTYLQRANIPLQGLNRCELTVGAISGTDSQLGALLLAPFHQSWIYTVGKKHLGKADQSTLASGGSEHA